MQINPYETPVANPLEETMPRKRLAQAYKNGSSTLESIAQEVVHNFPFLHDEDPTKHNIYNDKQILFGREPLTKEQQNVQEYVFGYPKRMTNYNILTKIAKPLFVASLGEIVYGLTDLPCANAALVTGLVTGAFTAVMVGGICSAYKSHQKLSNDFLNKSHDIIKKVL